MFFLIVFYGCLFVAGAVGVMAAISDYRGMTIPNLYSVIIFLLFPVCYAVLWAGGYAGVFAPALSHLLGFVVVFLVTFVMFAVRIWGGGDQKLISAYSVWMGFSGLAAFLIYVVLFGGILALAALLLRRFKPFKNPAEGSWVEQIQSGGNKVPYGIAITAGALASFAKLGYIGMDTVRIFL